MKWIHKIPDALRNFVLFRIKYRWIRRNGYVNCRLSAKFSSPHKHIILGDHVGIGYRCVFSADIEIGNKVMIGSDVALVNSDDHQYDVVGKAMWDSGRGDKYKIVIEDDVWIGFGAIILSPARIGRGAIVAAGSLVTHNIPRYAIAVGVPAQVVRKRFSPERIKEHERLLGYDHPSQHDPKGGCPPCSKTPS